MCVYAESKPSVTRQIKELVARSIEGDRRAFDELVRLTHAEAYTLALRLTNDRDDAADVVQEAYLRAYKALPNFRQDAQFSTWMYRIVANCAATATVKRAKHRHGDLNGEQEAASPTVVDYDLDATLPLSRQELNNALAALPDGLRAVVVLRDIYDLPHSVIAKELGITEVTAKVRLHRGRKRLRDLLLPRLKEERRDV